MDIHSDCASHLHLLPLADALTCNAVVKSFGAGAREDARLGRVIKRWRVRVRRTWFRYNYTAMAQLSLLLCLRASLIGRSVLLWCRLRLARRRYLCADELLRHSRVLARRRHAHQQPLALGQ
ncbi:hypothetical protein ABIB85_008176 [Bradyrhizobium sp. JR1.5]